MNKKNSLLILFICLFANIGVAAVWSSKNSWSSSIEDRYSEWVRNEWSEDTFVNPKSMLEGVETDCADSVYAVRATFAYLNQLPFKTASKISNETNQFDSVSEGPKRFRAFLKMLMRETSSRTLPNDTYAVALTPQAFRAGIIYVAPGNHSYLIKDVQKDGMIVTYSSTVPVAVRLLMRLEGVPFYLPSDLDKKLDGYRAFRQPDQLNVKQEQLSQFSPEQFELAKAANYAYVSFAERLTDKISVEKPRLEKKIEHTLSSLCSYARERGAWVSLSSSVWMNSKKCMSPDQVEDYSTDSRDLRLKDFFQYLRKLAGLMDQEDVSSEIKEKVMAVFSGEGQSGCLVETYDPKVGSLKLSDVWNQIVQNKLISNPHATIAQRWGIESWTPVCEQKRHNE